jgi:hypothetical protein
MADQDEKKPASPSLPKLSLNKDRIRTTRIQTGVKTGMIMGCPAMCGIFTQIISVTKAPGDF